MKNNEWYKITGQSMAVFMRDAGFDLTVYDNYSTRVQEEARKAAIKEAMYSLAWEFEAQTGADLEGIKRGVYVISIADGLSIKYEQKRSSVIYIGIGNICSRIKQHYEMKLFEFMKSLSGVNFNFHVAEPKKLYYRKNDYHQSVEYYMLERFKEEYGQYPLMNKNSGSDKSVGEDEKWWRKPIKTTGQKIYWEISPTAASNFKGGLD